LFEPTTMAIVGVSSRRENFARMILRNTVRCGFPRENLTIIKDGEREIDGVRCVPSLHDLPGKIDLLVLAAGGNPAEFVRNVIDSGKIESVILIPGGMGETEGTEDVPSALREAIDSVVGRAEDRPVFLGGNCLGIRSRPGRYDTFFIPHERLDPMLDVSVSRAALIAQSGGFIISRLSNWRFLNPALSISIGNQLDLTVSDLLDRVVERDDIDVVGVYMEGFRNLDGVAFVQAVRNAVAVGKRVIFYKAGRTAAGRSAMEGHTASIAGDYDVCQSAVSQAGAIVTETFKEFEQVMELAVRLHDRPVKGRRLAAISNAGFETVGMADAIYGSHYEVEMAQLSARSIHRLEELFRNSSLSTLANIRNPLDLTPMADDETYEACLRILLEDDHVDGVVAALVPMAPTSKALPHQLDDPDSTASRLIRVFGQSQKPMAFVLDCGEPFVALARRIRSAGVPGSTIDGSIFISR
jgi:acyl-CoA synthetase (NDP forming)